MVISTGDFQIRWNVLSLSFSGRESGRWSFGRSDFYHNYLISNDCIQHSGKITICNTYKVSSESRKFEFNVFSIIHLNGHNF